METITDRSIRVAEAQMGLAQGPWNVNHRRWPNRCSLVRQIAKSEAQDCIQDLTDARAARRRANLARLSTQLLRRSIRLNQTVEEQRQAADRAVLVHGSALDQVVS